MEYGSPVTGYVPDPAAPPGEWELRQARACVAHCSRLADALAFWMRWLGVPILGLLAEWRANYLAEDLDNTAASIEFWIELADKRKAEA